MRRRLHELGRLGVLPYLDQLDVAQATTLARTVEQVGYSTLWFPETFGRDPFALATHLLANTEKLVVATGVANMSIFHRPASLLARRATG